MYQILAALTLAAAPSSTLDSETLQETLMIQPADATDGQRFGRSLDLHGHLAVIGTEERSAGLFAGSAYVYDVRTGTQVHKLLSSDLDTADYFGVDVAINQSVVAVGAPGVDDNGAESGAVYVFDLVTGQQLRKITPSDGVTRAYFGWSLDLDGDTLLVGAERDDDNGVYSGSAYLFNVTTGQQIAKMAPNDLGTNDRFGYAVAIDGPLAVVGARRGTGNSAVTGSAYVFSSATGQLITKLVGSDSVINDEFGAAVDVEAGRVLVGAHFASGAASSAGSAYLFEGVTGQEVLRLRPPAPQLYREFGADVALDGDRIFVGAPLSPAPPGSPVAAESAVLVYDLPSGTFVSRLVARDTGLLGASQGFGERFAVDGDTSIHGVGGLDTPWINCGAAYVFRGPFGERYCGPSATNSSGASGRIQAHGSAEVTLNDLTLVAGDLPPSTFTMFIGSRMSGLVPMFGGGPGTLCLGGTVVRFSRTGEIGRATAAGGRRLRVALQSIPEPPSMNVAVLPGETWYFSAWFRDGARSNFTDGVRVLFR